MSGQSISATSYPKWILSPDGDSLFVMTSDQVQSLGEKLMLKNRLQERNSELEMQIDMNRSRSNALAAEVRSKEEQIYLKDEKIAGYDAQIKARDTRIKWLEDQVAEDEKTIKRSKRWGKAGWTIAIAEAFYILIKR